MIPVTFGGALKLSAQAVALGVLLVWAATFDPAATALCGPAVGFAGLVGAIAWAVSVPVYLLPPVGIEGLSRVMAVYRGPMPKSRRMS
jgi:hypothetical protein